MHGLIGKIADIDREVFSPPDARGKGRRGRGRGTRRVVYETLPGREPRAWIRREPRAALKCSRTTLDLARGVLAPLPAPPGSPTLLLPRPTAAPLRSARAPVIEPYPGSAKSCRRGAARRGAAQRGAAIG